MHLNTNQVFSTEVVFLRLQMIHLHVVMSLRTSVSFRWIIGWLIIITISREEDRALVTVTLQRKLKRRELELCAERAWSENNVEKLVFEAMFYFCYQSVAVAFQNSEWLSVLPCFLLPRNEILCGNIKQSFTHCIGHISSPALNMWPLPACLESTSTQSTCAHSVISPEWTSVNSVESSSWTPGRQAEETAVGQQHQQCRTSWIHHSLNITHYEN